MSNNRYFCVFAALFAMILLGSSAMPYSDDKPKNLKILPKDISNEALDKIMDEYNDALGVKCNFCHSPLKEDISKLDYASDAKPAKDIARNMMRMTTEINKQFFKGNKGKDGKDIDAVTCITCHNGQEYPSFKK